MYNEQTNKEDYNNYFYRRLDLYGINLVKNRIGINTRQILIAKIHKPGAVPLLSCPTLILNGVPIRAVSTLKVSH